MKMRVLSFVLALFALTAILVLPASAKETSYLIDEANELTSSEQSEIDRMLKEISEKYDCLVMIETVNGETEYTYEDYAIFRANSLKAINKRVVLFVYFGDIRVYDCEIRWEDVSDKDRERGVERILDVCLDDFKADDRLGGFKKVISETDVVLDAFKTGKTPRQPYPVLRNVIITIIVALVVGVVYISYLKKKLKSVGYQKNAANYVKSGSMNVTSQKDIYLYSTVTRTARPKNTRSSSGSGGSRGGGGSGGSRHF